MAEPIKNVGHGRTRPSFLSLESFLQRQLWPARLAVMVAVLAIAFLVGALSFRYRSRLYVDCGQDRLLHRATPLLQEGRLSKAAQTAHDLLARRPDALPALY